MGHAGGADDPGPSLGVAAASYDNDGWVELVVGNYDRGYRIFHNDGSWLVSYHWLALSLVGGGRVNRDAIGARVVVSTTDGSTQMQEVKAGSSVGAGETMVLHFGLGEAAVADVTVRWPDSPIQRLGALASDRSYVVSYTGGIEHR